MLSRTETDPARQLDNGQPKYVYPIGVHSGEYLGTLLNRTTASGRGYHFVRRAGVAAARDATWQAAARR